MPEVRVHNLKTWPEMYQAIVDGRKNFEVRLNDRDYKVGDVLILWEWDPFTSKGSGRGITRKVTFVLDEPGFGLKPGYVCMALA